MKNLLSDLRYAVRTLPKSSGLVLVALLSLGLGIGVNATLFSIFNAMFLRPPTASRPDGLLRIWIGSANKASYPNYRDLSEQASGVGRPLEALVFSRSTTLNLRDAEIVEKVSAQILSNDFFVRLGIQPELGRVFSGDAARPERNPRETVISHGCWKRRFGGDSQILGRAVNLNGQIFTITGVLPKDYRSVEGLGLVFDFHLPLSAAIDPEWNQRRRATLDLIGVMTPDSTPQQVRDSLIPLSTQLHQLYPEDNPSFDRPPQIYRLSGLSGFEGAGGPREMVIFSSILFAVTALILMIACANVASLLLARGASRRREIAVRLALGASRLRLIQHLLAESFVLAIAGAGLGMLLALWLTSLAVSIPLPVSTRIELRLEPDLRVILYALATALFTGLLCGLPPALQSTRSALTGGLKEDQYTRRRFTLRNGLVVGQVAVSMVLLASSFLFLRSLRHIGTVDPGFNVDHTLSAKVELDRGRYPEQRRTLFLQQAIERVQAVPGVHSATTASIVPLAGDRISTKYEIEGQPETGGVRVNVNYVGSRYFETMQIPLMAGREFTSHEVTSLAPVAIINETLAKRHFPGTSAVGKRLLRSADRGKPSTPLEIAGVARDSKFITLGENPTPVVYEVGGYQLQVRAAVAPATIVPAIRDAIGGLDATAPVEVKTMREQMAFAFLPYRIGAILLASAGGLGLMLAMIGLYGVLAYSVSRRTSELGLRMALGAPQASILRLILRDGLVLVGTGIAIGLTLALALTRPLGMFLAWGVSAVDPISFAATSMLLIGVGLVASYVPASRALRVDPLVALRCE